MTSPAARSHRSDEPSAPRRALHPVTDLPGGDLSAAPVWWARLAHRGTCRVEHSLVAVGSGRFPAGTLVTPGVVAARGLAMADHVGELRWWTRSGLVEDVRVLPELAGRGMGRLLAGLAGGLAVLRGWPPLTESFDWSTAAAGDPGEE